MVLLQWQQTIVGARCWVTQVGVKSHDITPWQIGRLPDLPLSILKITRKPPTMSESNWYKSRALVFITISVFLTTVFVSLGSRTPPIIHKPEGEKGIIEQWCPLPALPEPFDDGLKSSDQFNDNGALEVQVVRLSDAVNVPTVSWDDNGDVNVDTRWEPFFKFHDVLEKTFPLV